MKLSLFERLLLVVIVQVMFYAGVPAKHREKLSKFLYETATKGELSEKNFKNFIDEM